MPKQSPIGFRFVRLVLIAAAAVAVAMGCTAARKSPIRARLSSDQALELAVGLANEECRARFSRTPFDRATSDVQLAGGRWSWGGLDHAGPEGLSAAVSFDEFGGDRHVEVYLSTDGLTPVLSRDSTPQ